MGLVTEAASSWCCHGNGINKPRLPRKWGWEDLTCCLLSCVCVCLRGWRCAFVFVCVVCAFVCVLVCGFVCACANVYVTLTHECNCMNVCVRLHVDTYIGEGDGEDDENYSEYII